MKRLLDMIAAAAGLVVALPVIVVFSVLIRKQSGASGIFAQDRVGKNERVFRCYKLRTMRQDTPDLPTHMAGSASVTPIGKFLRRYKVDELPQLWNVVKGEMSLVGPRPCLLNQTELREERRSRGVFDVRPGITGLAQIEGIDMSEPARLAEKDAEYVQRQTLASDLAIIVRTIIGGEGRGDRVRP